MGYLIRSLEKMISDVKEGRTQLSPEAADQLAPELEKVERDEQGNLILASCSPALRSMARAYVLAGHAIEEQTRSPAVPPEPVDPVLYTHDLFEALEVLFLGWTGRPSREFVRKGEDFADAVHRFGRTLKASGGEARTRMQEARRAMELLDRFYKNRAPRVLPSLRGLGGSKLVLGGKQSFSEASVDAVRSMLLYADTVLIPDPVFPWFEVEPTRESFPRIRMLESAWYLLRLRPLVEADLSVPPIVVFPSWEKLLETKDVETQRGIEREALTFFSHYLGTRFDDLSELMSFANDHAAQFIASVERHRLFVAPGGEIGMDLRQALERLREENRRWRSPEFLAALERLSDAQLICHSIMERLVPLYHLSENASVLRGAPLVSLGVHWHYVQLRMRASEAAALGDGITDEKTLSLLQVLEDGPTRWLGNVVIHDLVTLRRAGANAQFRSRMSKVLDRLGGTDVGDLRLVAGEVAHEFRSIVAEHDAEVQKIRDKYSARNASFLAGTVFSAAASLAPWLPAIVPAVAGVGAVGALVTSGTSEFVERRQLRRTLLGVLAASARKATTGDD